MVESQSTYHSHSFHLILKELREPPQKYRAPKSHEILMFEFIQKDAKHCFNIMSLIVLIVIVVEYN